MKWLFHSLRTPEDNSVRYQILSWILAPYRLFRQRTSVNLAVSYVAMALVTITLLLLSVAALIVWPALSSTLHLEDITIDGLLGERSRAYAQWLDPDTLEVSLANGVSPQEQQALSEQLTQLVSNTVPGLEERPGASSSLRIAHAAVFDTSGNVIASDDPTWIAPGDPASNLSLSASRTVVRRSLALRGDLDPTWDAQYSMDVSNERTAASTPLIASDGTVVGYLLIEGNPLRMVISGESRGDLFRFFITQYWRVIWIFTLPAILVAIPFGVWRSRSISVRLERLADAADAMAEGALDTRVKVNQRDEIDRLGERFNQMASTIESNDRIRRAFMSNVSHELRTPITIIQGTVERALDRSSTLSPEQVQGYQVIRRESDMLGRMINDLFTLTRIDEQSLRLEKRSVNFHEIAAESTSSISDLAWSQSRVSVESLIATDLPNVYVDPTRIRQVLNNLLYNSLRHTPEGGLVVVQARLKGDMLDVSVSDTGRGIPQDELAHVFDRYYQAERGQRHDDGSGLGLSIVQQLVRAHGGEVSVESMPGEGTTFRFTLPLAS